MVMRKGGRKNMKKGRKPRTTWRPKKGVSKRVYSQTYTEVLAAGEVQTNQGGLFLCRFLDIPQHAHYSALYKQFCIKKLEVHLLPKFTEYYAGTPETNYLYVPRIAYAINDTPALTVPTSEVQVLTDNGVKVQEMNKKIILRCWPKPEVGAVDVPSSLTVATRQRKQVWLNTSNEDVTNNGETVRHGGISYFISGNPAFSDYQFSVYYKITFQMRDPA